MAKIFVWSDPGGRGSCVPTARQLPQVGDDPFAVTYEMEAIRFEIRQTVARATGGVFFASPLAVSAALVVEKEGELRIASPTPTSKRRWRYRFTGTGGVHQALDDLRDSLRNRPISVQEGQRATRARPSSAPSR